MSASLLLDYHNTIKPNRGGLKSFMKKIKFDSFYPSFFTERSGVVIVIASEDFETLDSLEKNEKILYINSVEVAAHCGIIYDDKKGIVMTPLEEALRGGTSSAKKTKKFLENILECVLTYLPNDEYMLAIFPANSAEKESGVHIYSSLGFENPFLVSTTPFGDEIVPSLALTRKNEARAKEKGENSLSDISFVLSKGTTCAFNFEIGSESLDLLENLCKRAGSTLNKDKSISQKEVSGGFRIVSSRTSNGLDVYLMEIDPGTTSYNKNESAEISPSLYNFHTHPNLAYKNHGVGMAWPSPDDYSAFLNSVRRHNTIFHVLASMEGIYLISLSERWAINYDSLDAPQEWILENYNFRDFLPEKFEKKLPREREENYIKKMAGEYIKKINKIRYEGSPVFKVRFSRWRESRTFGVVYPRFAGNCFYSPRALEMFRKFYSRS